MSTGTLEQLGLRANLPLPRRQDWRIGVIGLGGISRAHLPAYRSAGWQVVAACDLDPQRREAAGAEYGIGALVEDYRAVIEDSRVEVVSLLTQPGAREEIVRACVAVGKPVLTEKPLALDLAACERMVAVAHEAGVPFAVNQNYRWLPGPFAARELIRAGVIGQPFFVSVELHGSQDRELADHPFYSRCADFLTIQWNSHLADLVRCFMGRDPERVCARTSRMAGQAFAADNLLTSMIDFGREGTGLIVHNELHRGGMSRDRIRVEGDRGTLSFSLWSGTMVVRADRFGAEPISVDCAAPGMLNSFCGPMADLLLWIETGRESEVSARQNVTTIRQILAEDAGARQAAGWQSLTVGPAKAAAASPVAR